MNSFKYRFEARAKALGSEEIYDPGAKIVDVPQNVREKYKSAGAAAFAWGRALIDSAKTKYAGIVLSSIWFGQYGVSGTVAFSALINYARGAGMIVICDERLTVTEDNAKYAALAFLTDPAGSDLSETGQMPIEEHGFNVDAVTVSAESSKNGLEMLCKAASDDGREIMAPDTNGALKGILSGLSLMLR